MSDYFVNMTPNGGVKKYDEVDVINIIGLHNTLSSIYYGTTASTIEEARNKKALSLVELINTLNLHDNVVLLIGGTYRLYELVCELLPKRKLIYCP
jgi:hypothetical protein